MSYEPSISLGGDLGKVPQWWTLPCPWQTPPTLGTLVLPAIQPLGWASSHSIFVVGLAPCLLQPALPMPMHPARGRTALMELHWLPDPLILLLTVPRSDAAWLSPKGSSLLWASSNHFFPFSPSFALQGSFNTSLTCFKGQHTINCIYNLKSVRKIQTWEMLW